MVDIRVCVPDPLHLLPRIFDVVRRSGHSIGRMSIQFAGEGRAAMTLELLCGDTSGCTALLRRLEQFDGVHVSVEP